MTIQGIRSAMPSTVMNSKTRPFTVALRLLANKNYDLFLCLLSHHIPDWIFKYNSGTIMRTTSPMIPVRNYSRYICRKASESDLEGISKLNGLAVKDIARRMADGDWCYIIEDISNGSQIMAVCWAHIGHCYIRGFGLDLKLDEKSAYLFGAFSAPSVRFTGVFNSLLAKIISDLKSRDINYFCGLIECRNRLAYRYHLRLNFQPAALVKYIKILSFRISSWADLSDNHRRFRFFFKKPKFYI